MAHKKHKRKYLNILMIPDDESSTKNLKIRYSFITAGIILLVFVSVGLLVGIFTYGQLLQRAYENISLKQQNKQLHEQLQKVNDLTRELNQLKTYEKKVQNSLTGYIKISEDMGSGESGSGSEKVAEKSVVSALKSIPVKKPLSGFVSQEFKLGLHNGIDIVAPEGTPILSAANGSVLFSGYTIDGGYTIILGHSNGYYTYYKHNLRNLVYTSQDVEQGEVIGYLGNSGQKSYGPHLHFEIWKDGRSIDPRHLILEFN